MESKSCSNRKSTFHRCLQHVVPSSDPLQGRLRHWQQVRSWVRLIREVEPLWHFEDKEFRRLGAMELSQLFQEMPLALRPRVNRWLDNYSAAMKLNSQRTKLKK